MLAAARAVFAALACVASSQPVFPDGVGSIVGSAAALQRGAVAPGIDESTAIQHLKETAAARLEEDLAESFTRELLHEDTRRVRLSALGLCVRQAAFATAHVHVLQKMFVGGCPRDTAGSSMPS